MSVYFVYFVIDAKKSKNISGWTVNLMKDIMKHETVHDLSSRKASISSVQGE